MGGKICSGSPCSKGPLKCLKIGFEFRKEMGRIRPLLMGMSRFVRQCEISDEESRALEVTHLRRTVCSDVVVTDALGEFEDDRCSVLF